MNTHYSRKSVERCMSHFNDSSLQIFKDSIKHQTTLIQKCLAQKQSRMRPVGVFSVDQFCYRMMEAKYRADSDTQTDSRLKLNGLFCITGDIYANIKIAPCSRCCPVRENCFTGQEREERKKSKQQRVIFTWISFSLTGEVMRSDDRRLVVTAPRLQPAH